MELFKISHKLDHRLGEEGVVTDGYDGTEDIISIRLVSGETIKRNVNSLLDLTQKYKAKTIL
jgi:hypothetical protein